MSINVFSVIKISVIFLGKRSQWFFSIKILVSFLGKKSRWVFSVIFFLGKTIQFSYWGGLKTVLYVTNGCFWKESLGWLLRNTRSCSRYLKVSPDFQEHIGYIFGGVRHHLRKIWSQEIELFSNENFQNLEIFSDFHHLPWKSKILDGEP